MRVAIIGAGSIAEVHVSELQSLGQEVVMAVGTNLSRTEKFAEKWGIEKSSVDYREAFTSDIDVVHICVPPALHYEITKEALKAGKHVICEKPLCLDVEESKELMNLANEKNLVNGINFNVRFHDACEEIKGSIESGEIGKINLIHGSYLQEFHALPADYSWRYQDELAGPTRATSEIGSHWIDLARYLTGLEIVEVSANYGKFNPERYVRDNMMYADEEEHTEKIHVNSDDCATVLLRFSNGAIGNIVLSEISHGRNNQLRIDISGTKKSIWWNNENPYTVNSAGKFTGVNAKTNAFGGGFPSTFKNFFAEVYKDMAAGEPSKAPKYPTFKDGYINSAVCNAIYESANNNAKWTEVE